MLSLATVADLLEAGFKILLLGPVLGAVLGGLGGMAARPLRSRTPAAPRTPSPR